MERLKTLKYVIWIAALLLVLQLSILIAVMFPLTNFLWLTVAVVAIVGLYLVRIALVLLGELEKKEKDGK